MLRGVRVLQLTAEFVELMEGPRSATFKRFRELCVKTYMELRRQRHKVILLVEMVANGNENLPCFAGNAQVRRRRRTSSAAPPLVRHPAVADRLVCVVLWWFRRRWRRCASGSSRS